MPIPEHALAAVCDRASLFRFLNEQLDWPVDPEDPFTYGGPRLHEEVAARAEVSQIVPFTTGDPYTIMLVEFETPFRRTDLREILRRMREEIRKRAKYGGRSLEEIIFVCATENYGGIRFVRFEEQAGRQPRMSVFGWECAQTSGVRTLLEFNLPALTMPPQNVLGEYDWSRSHWAEAWNVEKVTREFFREYRAAFERVEQSVQGVSKDRRLFTQRLFNRLMFIQFLSKRGWLRFEGSTDYLPKLYTKALENGENFYRDRLYWVFFYGLGSGEVGQEAHDLAELKLVRGEVPYLNGGLFDMVDDDDARGAVEIDNTAFAHVLDLFTRWNFTISESTPLDVEVAVDPEMLGKVFEELVTGRRETGSYYTPRGIVAFMCREALKHYFEAAGIAPEAAATFVDDRSTVGFRDQDFETSLAALKRVRVVDPACGSGAYLLGMLHELVELRKLLFNPNRKDDPRDDYERKLAIIQRNLYGVDLDEFAVSIARLRLWLSLAVEYTGTTPEPLPNLDFKIEQGDSLSAPDPGHSGDIDMFRFADIAEFEEKKTQYANPYYKGDKRALKRQIAKMAAEIAAWTHKGASVAGFDWRVQFGEVFAPQTSAADWGGGLNLGGSFAEPDRPGGFDIVVANPPFVRQELIKEIKPTLKKIYPAVYNGTADLYTYFYARAVQLLKPGGVLAFISPNKWFKAGYGANLRSYLADKCHVHSIIDFGDLPVFESATAYPMICIAGLKMASASNEVARTLFTLVKSLDSPYPEMLPLIQKYGQELPAEAIHGAEWALMDSASVHRLRQMDRAGIPLGQYIQGQVFYGIKTGFNTAFIISEEKRAELIAQDAKSAEIIKPLAMGRDIRKWAMDTKGRWIIVTRIGIEMNRYPAIMQHLCQYQTELEKRWDKGEHWWELRACDYYEEFEKPKILYQEIATYQGFAFDTTGAFVNNKVFLIPTTDLYLLGVLNSADAWRYLNETCSKLSGGALAMQTPYLNKLPIPTAPEGDRQTISVLVQKCLDAKGVGCEAWEAEINDRVAALYGL